MNAKLRYVLHIARAVLWDSDTTTVRVILAVASVWFAFGLLPWFHTFNRQTWAVMGSLAPSWVWALAFLAHAIGVAWQLVDSRLDRVAFGINAYGLALWIFSTGLITAAVGEYSPGTAMELTVIFAGFVGLVRLKPTRRVVEPAWTT